MSKKNKQKNGFFYFMLDMKEELRIRGRNVPMNQMPVLAGPKWSQLSENQKAVYNLRAQHEKRMGYKFDEIQIMSRPGRMDCMGELLSERRDPLAEQQEKRRKQREYLREVLPIKKDVVLMKFYLLDIQPLCHLKDVEKDKYLPCEMAVLEYSLANGIHTSVHHFIDPGPIPVGHRYAAQSQSDQTHTLPVSGFELAEKDYRMLLSELQSFTCSGGHTPLIFAKRESVEKIEFLLQWMADKAGVDVFISEVFELELLMMALDSISNNVYPQDSEGATPSTGNIITDYQATELIDTTAYDYELNTKCDWHEQREVNNCSLATVNKYRYAMSDHLCPKFHISITPRHLPEQSDTIMSTIKVIPSARYGSNSRGVSRDIPELSTGMQNVCIARGRGRGMGLYKVRQPKEVVGRGRN